MEESNTEWPFFFKMRTLAGVAWPDWRNKRLVSGESLKRLQFPGKMSASARAKAVGMEKKR